MKYKTSIKCLEGLTITKSDLTNLIQDKPLKNKTLEQIIDQRLRKVRCRIFALIIFETTYRSVSSAHRIVLSAHRSVTSDYQSVLSAYRSVSSAYRSVSSAYRGVSSAYRSVSSAYRSVSSAYRTYRLLTGAYRPLMSRCPKFSWFQR